ncbi:MAG: MEDS domain-containing protein, partial [Vicinamibacterales bacterium]
MTVAWSGAPGAHTVQFYEHERALHRGLERFVGPALHHDEPVGMIARRRTFEAVADRRILFIDAETALADVMDGDMPDARRFEQGFGNVVADLRHKGAEGRIWLYGEMVDLLCQSGKHAAAIRLEELWNGLFAGGSLSVLCGYAMAHLDGEAQAGHMRGICQQHTHVISAAAESTVYV